MNLPKQSMPVIRILPSVSYSSQLGVHPSMRVDDMVRMVRRLFNIPDPSPGNCSCRGATTSLGFVENAPFQNRCNIGLSPQCDGSGGCFCLDSSLVENNGRVLS